MALDELARACELAPTRSYGPEVVRALLEMVSRLQATARRAAAAVSGVGGRHLLGLDRALAGLAEQRHLDVPVARGPVPLCATDDALAVAGYHRVGRIDAAETCSLWLLEEDDAIELRAGRRGEDARVRVTTEYPLYLEIRDVLAWARSAATWEDPRGDGLADSFSRDGNARSVHRADPRLRAAPDDLDEPPDLAVVAVGERQDASAREPSDLAEADASAGGGEA